MKPKNLQFKVEEIFDKIIPKDTISPEKINKIKNFLAEMM